MKVTNRVVWVGIGGVTVFDGGKSGSPGIIKVTYVYKIVTHKKNYKKKRKTEPKFTHAAPRMSNKYPNKVFEFVILFLVFVQ